MNRATPTDAPTAPAAAEPASADALEERFATHLEEQVRRPLQEALNRYTEALRSVVTETARRAEAEETAEPGPRARYEYAERFVAIFRGDLLDPADRDRAEFFRRVGSVQENPPQLPEEVELAPGDPGAPPPDEMVRPRRSQRLLGRFRRTERRPVPVGALSRLYIAEIVARLEEVVNRVASMDSVALAVIRKQLSDHVDPPPPQQFGAALPTAAQAGTSGSGGPAGSAPAGSARAGSAPADAGAEPLEQAPAPASIDAVAEAAAREMEAILAAARDGFERALAAPAINVDPAQAEQKLARAARVRERLLEDWQSFETGLHANTVAEAVLARALAALDMEAASVADALDDVLDRRAREPLDRLAEGLRRLAAETGDRLGRGVDPDDIEELRAEAVRLFDQGLPELSDRLPAELKQVADRFVATLDEIPDTVPEELRISDERIHGVPERPEPLNLRDAPLGQLLHATCEGALPRWVSRSLNGTSDELGALRRELVRVRNAVDFHIRAPLRGDFTVEEAEELISDSMTRAAAQLEELRDAGLDSVERVITELERRSAEEAEAVRVAVREREFLRMRSEIAEEQAVRQLSTGVEWARRLAETGIRLARRGWSTGRRTFDRTQDWAERQLGVGEVEREAMLETLEESLLGEESQRVAIPGLYRQLFDVEGEVPWEELLVPRDEEVATLERALHRWRRGQSASVAVIGEKGSGKTTLLRMAGELVDDLPVTTVELNHTLRTAAELTRKVGEPFGVDTTDPKELQAALQAREATVAVVEDAHHMFIRALGGFEAVEAFLELVASTRGSVFWVLTMDVYAWRYLDRVLGMAPHFTHVVNTTDLSAEKLERAVMARHEVSGYGLRFETGEENRQEGWWKRLRNRDTGGELSRRELERQAFFRELNQIAEGNIFLALFYWLRSVEQVEDHVLVLRKPQIIDLEFLERLPLPSLHTIAGIILHGGLSHAEHRRVFQLDAPESRLQLASLADAHLIFQSDDGEYKVNKVLYRPLIRLLQGKNIF